MIGYGDWSGMYSWKPPTREIGMAQLLTDKELEKIKIKAYYEGLREGYIRWAPDQLHRDKADITKEEEYRLAEVDKSE